MNFYELMQKMRDIDAPVKERAVGGRPGINSLTGQPQAPAAPEPDHLAEPPERAPADPNAPNMLANKTRMPDPAAAARAQRSSAANDLANQQQPREGNAYGQAVQNTPPGEEIKIDGEGTGDIKREEVVADECGMPGMANMPGGMMGMRSTPPQADSINANMSLNASGPGGIKNLMDILRNIEAGSDQQGDDGMMPQGDDDRAVMIKKLPGFDAMMNSETFANEPDEMYGNMDSSIRDGGDLNRSKRSFARAQPGDNPMAVESIKNKLSSLYEEIKSR